MTPTLLQVLAWSLLHFLWQGAAIAALAATLMLVFRKPAARYLLGVGALALMLSSFIVTCLLLGRAGGLPAAATGDYEPASVLVAPGTQTPSAPPSTGAHAGFVAEARPDFTWVARAWLLGVFLFALRIAFGLVVIEQLRRRNLVALPDSLVARFEALQARLGITRGIRFAECSLVNVPAVIGFLRPVVLIPVRALTGLSAEQLDALIAHELGHIKRFDVAVNFAQVIAETLFFFHPAVWWLNRRIRAVREECCDDIAVTAGGSPVDYARALAIVASWTAHAAEGSSMRRDVPSLAMAATGGPVAVRVARLLGVHRDGSRTAGVFAAALVLAGALVAGAVSLGLTQPAQAQTAEVIPALAAPPVPPAPGSVDVPVDASAAAAKKPPASVPAPKIAPSTKAVPVVQPVAAPRPVAAPTPPASGSYLDQMRAADLGDLDADSLVALRIHDVSREYIQGIRASGLAPSVDQLVALKSQGVTTDYVRQVRAMGFDADVDQIVAFKVHGISPEYVHQVRAMGFDADADEIIAMKVHGLSADYVKQMTALGLKFDADEVIAMRVHDISPEYVKQMRADGFDANTDQLIAMRVHDVTPDYRRSLEAAGFKLDVDDLVHAKVMGITPQFIADVAAHGFRNLKLEQLIALKNADVL